MTYLVIAPHQLTLFQDEVSVENGTAVAPRLRIVKPDEYPPLPEGHLSDNGFPLSQREFEAAHLVWRGLSNAQIARRMNIALKTLMDHVLPSMYGKTEPELGWQSSGSYRRAEFRERLNLLDQAQRRLVTKRGAQAK